MSPIIGIIASSISGNLWAPTGAYDALSTVTVPSGGVASITFAGIPTGYKHLQVRGISYGSNAWIFIQVNGDTGNNYSWHSLRGNGSAASAQGFGTTNNIYAGLQNGQTGGYVFDILDYANGSKYKTFRNLGGWDNNGSGDITLTSGSWQNTNAITSISLFPTAGSFSQYSQFTLYGVR